MPNYGEPIPTSWISFPESMPRPGRRAKKKKLPKRSELKDEFLARAPEQTPIGESQEPKEIPVSDAEYSAQFTKRANLGISRAQEIDFIAATKDFNRKPRKLLIKSQNMTTGKDDAI